VTLTGVVSSLATTPGHTYTFRGKLYVDQSRPTGWFARRGHQREHSVQQPAGLDRILIPSQRLKATRVVTVVVLMVASAWALQSSLWAEQAVNRRPMKIERSSPI
jgi:hypothetical protein